MAKLTVHKQGNIYRPSVAKNHGLVNTQTFVFQETSFTKSFTDSIGGTYSKVKIKSLPKHITLMLNSVPVTVDQEFFAVNSQNLSFELGDQFAIHNGRLYEFTSAIDDIIASQDAQGRKLIQNISGILWFVNPGNLGDIELVKGTGIENVDLEFRFQTSSSKSLLFSNEQIFCPVPWENVNIKNNFILQSGDPGGTGDNPITGFAITGSTTKTATITLADNTQLTATFDDLNNDVVVTDTNNRTNRVGIATANAVTIYETLTALVQPTLSGSVITWKYRNENGVEQSVTLDIADALPPTVTNIDVDYVQPDPDDTNKIQIVETDGTVHVIDLNKYIISTTTNEDGSLDVSQNNTVVFTIGLAGQTNNYYDLDNLPTIPGPFNLPPGIKDQLYFITEDGTNKVKPDWLMHRATVVQSQKEFDVASAQGISLKEVFERWEMFSHYNNTGKEGEFSPPYFPAINETDPQESTRLTKEEFYNRTNWSYDETNDRIFLSKNYHCYTGLISPFASGNFTFEATMAADDSDDDILALVIGFWEDPETGFQHTISVIRALVENSGQGNYTYQVVYNYGQTNSKILADATNTAPFPVGGSGGWRTMGPTRVQVIRTGDTYAIKCSQFGNTVIDDTTLVNLDLNSDPLLEPFKVSTRVGFSAKSQKKAAFTDVVLTGLTEYIFWDLGDDTYDTYEWNDQTEVFDLQSPQTTFAKDYIGRNRFIHAYLFDKVYHVDRNDKLICIKGDEGISWDPFNALSLGTDNRPFIDSRLVGGTENKKYSYVVQHLGGLDFKVTAAWRINGIDSGIPDPVVLNYTATPDATFSKYIMFVLNEDGTITVKEGAASANPQEPTLDDPVTQLKGSFVQINNNGSVEGFAGTLIFDENVGTAGGEFDLVFTPAGNTRFAANGTEPFSGTVGIDITSGQRFDAAEFTPGSPVPFAPGDYIQYKIKNKAFFNKGETHAIMIQGIESDGVTLSSVTLPVDPTYDANDSANWQVLTAQIPSGLSFTEISYVRFLITVKGNATYSGFVDAIELIGDTGVENPGGGVSAEYVRNEDEKYLNISNNYADSLVNVFFFDDFASFDVEGFEDTLYVDKETGEQWLWDDFDGLYYKPDGGGGVSVQNSQGVEQFFGTTIKFEGFAFDAANLKVINQPLTLYTIFVDTVLGDDANAEKQNIAKPFKTHQAAYDAIPDDGNLWTLHFIDGSVTRDISGPRSGYRLYSSAGGVFDYTNTPAGDTPTDEDVIIEIPNAELLAGGTGATFGSNRNDECHINIVANKITVSGTPSNNTYFGIFHALRESYITCNTLEVNTGAANIITVGYMTLDIGTLIINADHTLLANSHTHAAKPRNIKINEINLNIGTYELFRANQEPDNFTISRLSGSGNLFIGEVSAASVTYCDDLVVEPTINFHIFQTSSEGYISGRIISTNNNVFMGENETRCNPKFVDFDGQVVGARRCYQQYGNGGDIVLINSNIKVPSYFIHIDENGLADWKSLNSFRVEGVCSIISETDYPQMVFGVPKELPVVIELNGLLRTNFETFGRFVTGDYVGNTFKEKLGEIVVRSKHDLINKPLSSSLNYIVDGNLELLSGEHIIVPEGGLSINGYSFDASSISSYGVNYHDIFISETSKTVIDDHSTRDGTTYVRAGYGEAGIESGDASIALNGATDGMVFNLSGLGFNSFYTGNDGAYPLAGPYSVGIWFYPIENNGTVFGMGLRNTRENIKVYVDGSNNLKIQNGRYTTNTITTGISLDTWHYVEVKWDGTNLIAHHNGSEITCTANTGDRSWNHNGDEIHVGVMVDTYRLNAKFSRLFVYSAARSTAESNATYTNKYDYAQELKTNLASYYSMNDVPTGGSGNLIMNHIAFTVTGNNARVLNIQDIDGTHAIEMNDVNFNGCSRVGKINGYRQFTGTTCGFYGCGNGFELGGQWSGFKISNSNCFGFASTGTFFTKLYGLLFSNRFYIDMNLDLPAGAVFVDFEESNFASDDLFQINNSIVKLGGVTDAATNTPLLIPNIGPNDPKARWSNSIGITLSAILFRDFKSPNGTVYRLEVDNDGNLSLGGTQVGGGGSGGTSLEPWKLNRVHDSGVHTSAITVPDATKISGVFLNGKRLNEVDEWTETDPTTVTINKTLVDGDLINIVSHLANAIISQVDLDIPVIVSASRDFAESDIGKILFVTASVTLTYPSGGIANFKTNIECNATGDVTIADTNAGADLDVPNGDTLAANESAYLFIEPIGNKLRISK